MALINVLNIAVHDNPAKLLSPFHFEITFECTGALDDDLEWRVIYVGSAESSDHDQELDNVLVGPVPVGTNKFALNVSSPERRPWASPETRPDARRRATRVWHDRSRPQTDPPDSAKIPATDLIGVTVVLVTCSFKGQEFIRVGYYVNNSYAEELPEGEPAARRMPPRCAGPFAPTPSPLAVPYRLTIAGDDAASKVDPAKILRHLLDDKPRVTRFPIKWE